MRTFRLTDAELAALAAGRPHPRTLTVLRRAELSRHLLLITELHRRGGQIPRWYADRGTLADPMAALHTATLLAATPAAATPAAAAPAAAAPAAAAPAAAAPAAAAPTVAAPAGATSVAAPVGAAAARIALDRVTAGRHLTATHDGLTLRLRLEDTDPLRSHLGLTPSPRLSADDAAEWQRSLSAAWRLLVTRHRPAAETVAAVLTVLIPVEPDPGTTGLSATSADAYGAMALSAPADPVAFAVGLLHEAQHSLLNATRTLFDLVTPGAPRTYSPWRDDPRPVFGLLHGAYAYLAVTRFWRSERSAGGGRIAEFEFARWRAAVASAAGLLLAGGHLTAAGARFVQAMRDEVDPWLAEPVDAGVARLADGANAEHRARWRLRNLAIAPGSVAALAEAWRRGEPAPIPEPELRTGGGRALETSTRLALVHRLLRGSSVDHGTAGDLAYLRGDAATALDAYRKSLVSGEAEPWVGMALVSPARSIRERLELVRATCLALPDVDLDTVVAWLDVSLNSPPR
ncbi:aKG-HExxH-type peptide beta-hydroxylase [Actinoplanes sp. CA-030573]|uniref:aKG-HExxH-type peptide beta-hydroxylase n=1 Tax=Actinoplanes sp. CA-030573 TaxID=3239898 RepID=UPI003D8FD2BA